MSYDAWVFPYYLTQRFGTDVIRAIEESREQHPLDVQVDKAIPGGFRERYPEFSLYAYNQAPVPGVPGIASTFAQWDGFATAPKSVPSKTLARGDNPLPMETVRPLAREYRQVLVDDQELRKIEFHNPMAADPDLHVRALVRRADGSWTSENWDGKARVEFCRDDPDEDVREVILAYSNTSLDRRFAPPTRFQAEESCSLRFKVARRERPVPDRRHGRPPPVRAPVRPDLVQRQRQRAVRARDERARDQVRADRGLDRRQDGRRLERPSRRGLQDRVGRARAVQRRPAACQPAARRHVGGQLRGDGRRERRRLDAALGVRRSVGRRHRRLRPTQCFVFISGQFDQKVSERQVPRSTFLQTEPFTLTFEGSGTATSPVIPNAALNHEWRYSITMQRL